MVRKFATGLLALPLTLCDARFTATALPFHDSRVARPPKKVRVQLDWPPADRWNFTKTDPFFKNAAADVKGYVTQFVPRWI